MKKKILSMVCAIILGVTCFAPLNIKAEFISPRSTAVNIYDSENNKVMTCTITDGGGCGTSWNGRQYAFERYQVVFTIDIPNNYTVRQHVKFKMTGLAMSTSTAPILKIDYSTNGGWYELMEEFSAHEHWTGRTYTSEVEAFMEFKNTTGANVYAIEYNYYNFGGVNSAQYTLFSIPHVTTNIYDEQGRLVQKIEDGVNLLHNDLGTINSNIVSFRDYMSQWITNASTWIVDTINKQKQEITNKLNDLINAIRGDDKKVESSNGVGNTTNQFEDSMNSYNDIESGIVDQFSESIGQIGLGNDLYQNNDFLKTGTFVATQMSNIYNSHDTVRMMLTFGMIIGLAFTIIGIKVKR